MKIEQPPEPEIILNENEQQVLDLLKRNRGIEISSKQIQHLLKMDSMLTYEALKKLVTEDIIVSRVELPAPGKIQEVYFKFIK